VVAIYLVVDTGSTHTSHLRGTGLAAATRRGAAWTSRGIVHGAFLATPSAPLAGLVAFAGCRCRPLHPVAALVVSVVFGTLQPLHLDHRLVQPLDRSLGLPVFLGLFNPGDNVLVRQPPLPTRLREERGAQRLTMQGSAKFGSHLLVRYGTNGAGLRPHRRWIALPP
jgi:hypothetical protein